LSSPNASIGIHSSSGFGSGFPIRIASGMTAFGFR
jgi:hypothetical protein